MESAHAGSETAEAHLQLGNLYSTKLNMLRPSRVPESPGGQFRYSDAHSPRPGVRIRVRRRRHRRRSPFTSNCERNTSRDLDKQRARFGSLCTRRKRNACHPVGGGSSMTGISQNRRTLRGGTQPSRDFAGSASTRREFLRSAARGRGRHLVEIFPGSSAVAPRSKKKVVVVTFAGAAIRDVRA